MNILEKRKKGEKFKKKLVIQIKRDFNFTL